MNTHHSHGNTKSCPTRSFSLSEVVLTTNTPAGVSSSFNSNNWCTTSQPYCHLGAGVTVAESTADVIAPLLMLQRLAGNAFSLRQASVPGNSSPHAPLTIAVDSQCVLPSSSHSSQLSANTAAETSTVVPAIASPSAAANSIVTPNTSPRARWPEQQQPSSSGIAPHGTRNNVLNHLSRLPTTSQHQQRRDNKYPDLNGFFRRPPEPHRRPKRLTSTSAPQLSSFTTNECFVHPQGLTHNVVDVTSNAASTLQVGTSASTDTPSNLPYHAIVHSQQEVMSSTSPHAQSYNFGLPIPFSDSALTSVVPPPPLDALRNLFQQYIEAQCALASGLRQQHAPSHNFIPLALQETVLKQVQDFAAKLHSQANLSVPAASYSGIEYSPRHEVRWGCHAEAVAHPAAHVGDQKTRRSDAQSQRVVLHKSDDVAWDVILPFLASPPVSTYATMRAVGPGVRRRLEQLAWSWMIMTARITVCPFVVENGAAAHVRDAYARLDGRERQYVGSVPVARRAPVPVSPHETTTEEHRVLDGTSLLDCERQSLLLDRAWREGWLHRGTTSHLRFLNSLFTQSNSLRFLRLNPSRLHIDGILCDVLRPKRNQHSITNNADGSNATPGAAGTVGLENINANTVSRAGLTPSPPPMLDGRPTAALSVTRKLLANAVKAISHERARSSDASTRAPLSRRLTSTSAVTAAAVDAARTLENSLLNSSQLEEPQVKHADRQDHDGPSNSGEDGAVNTQTDAPSRLSAAVQPHSYFGHASLPVIMEDVNGTTHMFCTRQTSMDSDGMRGLMCGWLQHHHCHRMRRQPVCSTTPDGRVVARDEEQERGVKREDVGPSQLAVEDCRGAQPRPLALHLTEQHLPWLARQLCPDGDGAGLVGLQELYLCLAESLLPRGWVSAWQWCFSVLRSRRNMRVVGVVAAGAPPSMAPETASGESDERTAADPISLCGPPYLRNDVARPTSALFMEAVMAIPSLQVLDLHGITGEAAMLLLHGSSPPSLPASTSTATAVTSNGKANRLACDAVLACTRLTGLREMYVTVCRDCGTSANPRSTYTGEIYLSTTVFPSLQVLWLDAPRLRRLTFDAVLVLRELHLISDSSLFCSGLSGVERLACLEVLHVERAIIDDCAFLGECCALRELLLHACRLSFSLLSASTEGGTSGGSGRPTEELRGVERAPHLETLSLCYTEEIRQLTNFSRCRSLRQVMLTRCNGVSSSSIAGFERLPRLELLALEYTRVSELTHLAKAPALRVLRVDGCKRVLRSSVMGLEMAPYLTELSLQDTNVSTVANFGGGCTALQSLDLSGCRHLDVDGLQGIQALPQLEVLSLSHTPITDVNFLADCLKLTTLYLEGCTELLPTALEELWSSPVLQKIVANGCRGITKVGELGRCRFLEVLSVAGAAVLTTAGVQGIERNPRLRFFDLSRTAVDSLSFLARGCQGLRYLSVKGCTHLKSLRELHGVEALPQLETLNMEDLSVTGKLDFLTMSASLQHVSFSGCTGLTEEDVRVLQRSAINTAIP